MAPDTHERLERLARRALRDPAGFVRGLVPGARARREISTRDARIAALEEELRRCGLRPPEAASPVFFVVGFMRSGTTWLMRMLDAHPEVLCRGEGRIFGAGWKRKALKKNDVDRPASSLYEALLDAEYLRLWVERSVWSRDGDPREHIEAMTRMAAGYFMTRELLKSGKRLVGDKSPLLNDRMVREISRIYPEARVIHIIRDGRDVAVSAAFHLWNFGNVKEGTEIAEKRAAYRADPEGFVRSGRSIFTGDQLRTLASDWSSYTGGAAQDGPALLGDRYMEVRYEDLVADPERHMRNIFSFLGAVSDEETVAGCVRSQSFERLSGGRGRGEEDASSFFRKGVAGDWRRLFTTKDREIFEETAGETLARLGYERNSS